MAGVAGKVAGVAGNVALAEGVELEVIDQIYSSSPQSESVPQSAAVAVPDIETKRETEREEEREIKVQAVSDSA